MKILCFIFWDEPITALFGSISTGNSVDPEDQVIVTAFDRVRRWWGTWSCTPLQLWKTGPGRDKKTIDSVNVKIIVKLFHQLPRSDESNFKIGDERLGDRNSPAEACWTMSGWQHHPVK